MCNVWMSFLFLRSIDLCFDKPELAVQKKVRSESLYIYIYLDLDDILDKIIMKTKLVSRKSNKKLKLKITYHIFLDDILDIP